MSRSRLSTLGRIFEVSGLSLRKVARLKMTRSGRTTISRARSSILRGRYPVVEPIVINTSGFQMGCNFDGRLK